MFSPRKILAAGVLLCIPFFASRGELKDVFPAREGRILTPSESQKPGCRPALEQWVWGPDGEPVLKKKLKADDLPPRLPESSEPGIVYGESVSRNEFGIDGGVFPSPDGKLLAVYRKDERAVSLLPLVDIKGRTGGARMVRYPMNGMASEQLSLCVCDTSGRVLSTLDVTDFTPERYLTGISWTPDSRGIIVQVLDRSQHEMHLNLYRSADGSFVRTILSERNDAWVEPEDPVHFLGGGAFVYRTDNRDGWRNLYLCDTLGAVRRLTTVDADVYWKGCAPDGKGWRVYYTTTEFSPVERHLMCLKVDRLSAGIGRARIGKPQRLSAGRGWHDVQMSADCSRYIDTHSSFSFTGAVELRDARDGSLLQTLCSTADPLEGVAVPRIEFGTVPAADSSALNYYRFFEPCGREEGKKYPLIVYVYGGPHSQMVCDKWLAGIRMWEMVMTQRGYAVYVQDNRGTAGRGSAFEKAINRRCGQEEMRDQMAGLEALLERCPWIDRSRIGVHGWSYGGFMTLTLATSHPDIFKVAVAGGPVIDWKWYEVMYGERYMDTPETNPEGFELTSLSSRGARLSPEARVLVIQGMQDHTVLPQHSLSFVQNCISDGVQVEYFPYPLDEHNMKGKARLHLYEKITDFFCRYL